MKQKIILLTLLIFVSTFGFGQEVKQKLDSILYQTWDIINDEWENNSKEDFIYNTDGNVVQNTMYLWNINAGQWAIPSKVEFTYDDNENITHSYKYYWSESNEQWMDYNKGEYNYDDNGQWLQIIYSNWDNNQWVFYEKMEYTYDDNGNRLQMQNSIWAGDWIYNYKNEYIYDTNGNMIQEVTFDWDGQWDTISMTELTYINTGNPIQSLGFYWNGQWVASSKVDHTYNANGDRQSIKYNWDGSNNQWVEIQKDENTYDSSYSYSDLILPFMNYYKMRILFNYKLINWVTYNWDGIESNWNFFYQSEFYFSEQIITSVSKINGEQIKVFPNPISEYVIISLPFNVDQITFELFDLQGRKIISKEIRSDEKINMQDLNQGVYFYNLIIDGEKVNGKLFKQ